MPTPTLTLCGMTSPHSLSSAHDALIAIPKMFGYRPHESLVALPFADQRGGAAIRMDLPQIRAHHEPFMEALIEHLTRFPDCSDVLIGVYTQSPLGDEEPPYAELIDKLIESAAQVGIRVVCAAVRAGDGWREYRGDAGGVLDELEDPQAPMHSVAEAIAIEPAPEAHLTKVAGKVAEGYRQRIPGVSTALGAWRALMNEPDRPNDRKRAQYEVSVALGIIRPAFLEVLLADAAYGEAIGNEHARMCAAIRMAAEDESEGLEVDDSFANAENVTERCHLDPIDLDRSARALRVLRRILGALEPYQRADVFAAASWLEWARGGGTFASAYAHESHRVDPWQRLALTVIWNVELCITPGWIGMLGCQGGFRDNDFARLLGTSE